jgi:beta-alanine degradation protein BauB
VEICQGTTVWVPAQEHYGENIGDSPTHSIFVELKEPAPEQPDDVYLGPE